MASMSTQGGSMSSPPSSSSSAPQWKYKVFLSFRKIYVAISAYTVTNSL